MCRHCKVSYTQPQKACWLIQLKVWPTKPIQLSGLDPLIRIVEDASATCTDSCSATLSSLNLKQKTVKQSFFPGLVN